MVIPASTPGRSALVEVVGAAVGGAGPEHRPPGEGADRVREGGDQPAGGGAAADRHHHQQGQQPPRAGQRADERPGAGVDRPEDRQAGDGEGAELPAGQAEEPADPVLGVVAVDDRHHGCSFRGGVGWGQTRRTAASDALTSPAAAAPEAPDRPAPVARWGGRAASRGELGDGLLVENVPAIALAACWGTGRRRGRRPGRGWSSAARRPVAVVAARSTSGGLSGVVAGLAGVAARRWRGVRRW